MRFLSISALVILSGTAAAQGIGVRVSPQFVSYTLGAPSSVTITESAIPMFAYIPITQGLTLDVGSAYATATVKSTAGGQARESTISGMTDTQIRAIMNAGSDRVLITLGVSLPTGRSTADTSEQQAAALIGNDFLVFPISSMGSGFGGTGGIAVASPIGSWNLGAGVSMRTSMPFEPYEDGAGNKLRYTPGSELRARVGLDHPFGTGRAALGFTYSKFGDDEFQTSIYNIGDRLMSQAYVGNSYGIGDYAVSVWNLFRASGTLADGSATSTESITEVSAAYGVPMGRLRIEPGFSARTWLQKDMPTSFQSTASLRLELPLGRMVLSPSAGYTFGSIAATPAESASISGFRAQVTFRAQ